MEKCDIPTKLLISISARLKTFESVLHLTGPIGGLSQTDIDILKTAVARQIIKPSITGTWVKVFRSIPELFKLEIVNI